jgi:hypothetical protein
LCTSFNDKKVVGVFVRFRAPLLGEYFASIPLAEGRSLKELQSVKDQFFVSCQKGHPILSEEVYRQIESFAGYSFVKHILLVMP